jgi:hypothetical protein
VDGPFSIYFFLKKFRSGANPNPASTWSSDISSKTQNKVQFGGSIVSTHASSCISWDTIATTRKLLQASSYLQRTKQDSKKTLSLRNPQTQKDIALRTHLFSSCVSSAAYYYLLFVISNQVVSSQDI